MLTESLSEILLIKGENIKVEGQLLDTVLEIFEREEKKVIYGDIYSWESIHTLLENRGIEILQSRYKLTI